MKTFGNLPEEEKKEDNAPKRLVYRGWGSQSVLVEEEKKDFNEAQTVDKSFSGWVLP